MAKHGPASTFTHTVTSDGPAQGMTFTGRGHRPGTVGADVPVVVGFGAAFTAAPSVDARMLPGTGHCIDFHRAGAAFQREQLAFAASCAAAPVPAPTPMPA